MSETWWDYIDRASGGASQAAIAREIGVDKTTVWRWKTNDTSADPEVAIRFARAYNRPATEALVAAGHITQAEADLREVRIQLDASTLSDEDLAAEVARRLTGR